MNSLPIKPLDYYFVETKIIANQDFDESKESIQIGVQQNLFSEFDAETSILTATLTTNVDLNKFPEAPYEIHVVCHGAFLISPEPPLNERTRDLLAAQVLGGATREFITIITSRGPWRKTILPFTLLKPYEDQNTNNQAPNKIEKKDKVTKKKTTNKKKPT